MSDNTSKTARPIFSWFLCDNLYDSRTGFKVFDYQGGREGGVESTLVNILMRLFSSGMLLWRVIQGRG